MIIKSRVDKVIFISSLKGGVGKTITSLLIIKYLLSLGKKVKVFELDGSNRGLLHLINGISGFKKYINKSLVIEYFTNMEFNGRNTNKYISSGVKQEDGSIRGGLEGFDYGIIDGFIFHNQIPSFFGKTLKYINKAIYIVPNDITINSEDLKYGMRMFMVMLKNRVTFVCNNKELNVINSKRVFGLARKFYKEILQEDKLNEKFLFNHNLNERIDHTFHFQCLPKFYDEEVPFIPNTTEFLKLERLVIKILQF